MITWGQGLGLFSEDRFSRQPFLFHVLWKFRVSFLMISKKFQFEDYKSCENNVYQVGRHFALELITKNTAFRPSAISPEIFQILKWYTKERWNPRRVFNTSKWSKIKNFNFKTAERRGEISGSEKFRCFTMSVIRKSGRMSDRQPRPRGS